RREHGDLQRHQFGPPQAAAVQRLGSAGDDQPRLPEDQSESLGLRDRLHALPRQRQIVRKRGGDLRREFQLDRRGRSPTGERLAPPPQIFSPAPRPPGTPARLSAPRDSTPQKKTHLSPPPLL